MARMNPRIEPLPLDFRLSGDLGSGLHGLDWHMLGSRAAERWLGHGGRLPTKPAPPTGLAGVLYRALGKRRIIGRGATPGLLQHNTSRKQRVARLCQPQPIDSCWNLAADAYCMAPSAQLAHFAREQQTARHIEELEARWGYGR